MKFALGRKRRMTQVFDESGRCHPVTILSLPKLAITQRKTVAKDGYDAVQVGATENKRARGERREFSGSGELEVFEKGDLVTVSAVSKSKGFQGVVKRHGFKGGPRSHGQKHNERAPGSLGMAGVQRVFKNMRMAGRMGGVRVTVKNLKVVMIDLDGGILMLEGAVPGRPGTLVEIIKN